MEAPEDPLLEGEDEILISAIEHYAYCPRQCGLIHLEEIFEENVFTVRGRITHERVDEGIDTTRPGLRVARSIPLWSERLGLYGKADLVEFRQEGPYPVEYKPGRRHRDAPDLQLCAQALCLEEMLGVPVPRGAIYYAGLHRRYEVEFTPELRARTQEAVAGVRRMLRTPRLPDPANDERCPNCSLADPCLPSVVADRSRLRGLQGALFRPLDLGESDA
ncbi:MAG: CRISPR-associated protein Cas4 [Sphingomonadaceae bacterium]